MSAKNLASEAQVGINTVKRAEAATGPITVTAASAALIARALEDAGVIFISSEGQLGEGVRLRVPSKTTSPEDA